MSATPERPAEIRDTRSELDRLLTKLDNTLIALRVEIEKVQQVISDERKP
jgi:hypothetical protein